MRNVDYVIVGDGYGALFFAHQLIRNNKSFVIFSGGERSASHISAGIINPLVLKRFTRFWLAQEQITALHETLDQMETYTGKNYWIDERIYRILHDETEREIWSKKSKREDLIPFLSPDFVKLEGIENELGAGYVLQSGRLSVNDFFSDLFNYFTKTDSLIQDHFNYEKLNTKDSTYKDLWFKNIVFAEGMAVLNNPFFKDIPLIPNKGHQLNLKVSTELDLKSIKKKYFFFPMDGDKFYYGGTHDRDHLESSINPNSVSDLESSLRDFYKDDYELVEVNYALRPTVGDRRPIIGRHSDYENLYVFNGLGARGILNGNYFAKDLYNFIEKDEPLLDEIDLKRFNKEL